MHDIPDGVNVTVADNVKIHVEGADKQKVGQLAAEIKKYYPVEPYKGKGLEFSANMCVEKKVKNQLKMKLSKKKRIIAKASLAYS